jgi:hypothetical protein
MEYPSINIQGNIISSEILDKIRNEDIKFQQAADFGLDKKTSVRDEIGIAWAATRSHWTAFKLRRDRLKEGESGTAETRNSWMIPLLKELGYEVEKATAYIHPDTHKTYAISHKAVNRDGFPIHIMGINDDLDRRRETSGPRLSPHALTQEYLNNTEYVYALVTNGRYLRLLRDATRLVRLSYLEINLEKMMEEELYADFAILFRLLHVTRMPISTDQNEESYIEYYHQESLASGSRIREKLSKAVERSIITLANGFIEHPANETLCEEIRNGLMKPDAYYTYQLRLIYRLLFLIVTEERNLVYQQTAPSLMTAPIRGGDYFKSSKDGIEDYSRLRKIYYDHYSIERLRRLAGKFYFVDGRKNDLWEGLITTFRLFENGYFGEKLGIKPLGSGIFSDDALGRLNECKLNNDALLQVIRNLTFFENDNRQRVRVNYSDLDVEEFGSVYEGLLEYKPVFQDFNGKRRFVFAKGDERSKTGSHYTPEELVKPLIKHSLEYIIEEKLKEQDKEKALLSIRVCDVASGSGHILLSAARRIALELARVRTQEDQPSPTAFRIAIRDVIKNCIYGVDKNPLAIELCKVALWLESHNPGEPLGFLDHHIKCGDSIVGLAYIEELKNGIPNEAFKALPGDDKEIASAFMKRNKKERETEGQITLDFEGAVRTKMTDLIDAFNMFNQLPENTTEEILYKEKEYKRLVNSRNWQKLKEIANLLIAQFFIPKTIENKDSLVTDANFREYLQGTKGVPGQALAKTLIVSEEMKFYHWFLEFPEVFAKGGFDCVLGNPPFLGRRKLTGLFGDDYLEYLKKEYFPIGAEDIVTYFFRRIFEILSKRGFLSLISTNTISEGGARESGLDIIVSNGGAINHAVSSMKWPGLAAVYVSLISIFKGSWTKKFYLNNKEVGRISTYLDDSSSIKHPLVLKSNLDLSFKGSEPAGMGFILEPKDAIALLEMDPKNNKIIFPYLNGEDLNNSVNQSASRYIINFFNWDEDRARTYDTCYKIICDSVKPERQRKKLDKNGNLTNDYQLRYPLPQKWWIYGEKRPKLYNTIRDFEKTIVIARTSKTGAFTMVPTKQVLNANLTIIAFNKYYQYSLLQSTFHISWAWKYSTKLKTDLIYQPSDVFETFPFPKNLSPEQEQKLEARGEHYHEHRKQLMSQIQLGLTKTYNLFHYKELCIAAPEDELLDEKTYEKQHGKEASHLRKHLNKTPGTISFNEAVAGIIKLRQLHVEMDQAVLESYGWSDIELKHDFFEVDYLPENDRVRYTIHPDARREVLKRLLELNHKIHEEEVKEGLWDKKSTAKKNKKASTESGSVEEPEEGYGGVFNQLNL